MQHQRREKYAARQTQAQVNGATVKGATECVGSGPSQVILILVVWTFGNVLILQ